MILEACPMCGSIEVVAELRTLGAPEGEDQRTIFLMLDKVWACLDCGYFEKDLEFSELYEQLMVCYHAALVAVEAWRGGALTKDEFHTCFDQYQAFTASEPDERVFMIRSCLCLGEQRALTVASEVLRALGDDLKLEAPDDYKSDGGGPEVGA